MLIDLHVHSNHLRDSSLEPMEIITRLKNTPLDGLVFTDGGYYDDCEELRNYGREIGVVVLFGAEIHTDKGHMLIYLPDPKKLTLFKEETLSIGKAIQMTNELEGAIVAAHPYHNKDIDRPLGDGLFNIEGLTAVEVESGYSDNTANILAYDAAMRLCIPMTSGSATKTDFENLGAYATIFSGKITTEKELVDKLRNSRYYPVTIK